MVDLVAKAPTQDLLPLDIGGVTLQPVEFSAICSIAPFDGAEKSVSDALKAQLKLTLPKVGKSKSGQAGRIIWTGMGQVFLLDAQPPKSMAAAVTDQSDAWCVVSLEGNGVEEVLARLCPLDLRQMAAGDVARSLIGHMAAIITKTDKGFEIFVFRAFAKTLVHELSGAMTSVSAQRLL